MHIIRPGEINKRWVGKCDKCKAVVQADQSELVITAGDYLSDMEEFAWQDCPCCMAELSICFHREGTKSATRDLKG